MTNKERYINCALNKPVDRAPFMYLLGPWGETIEAWKEEGITDPNAWCSPDFGFDAAAVNLSAKVNLHYSPCFDHRILEEHGDHVIEQDGMGIIQEYIRGRSGIPHIIKNPVETWDDWNELKAQRLNADDPARFAPDYAEYVEWAKQQDAPIHIGTFPCGLFGTARDILGVENLCYMLYDEPELVRDIMEHLTDMWLALYEKVARDIQIDVIHIWEDMSGKAGSLISPAMVREFMMPNYKRIKDFAVQHNIPVMSVDTDGICDELIPLFEESGFNVLMPVEIAAGNDPVELRRRFPNMALMGGIDKRELEKGKDAIDRALDVIEPLLTGSGYFPALDHTIHPDISYENYCYYVAELRRRIFKYERTVD